MTAVALIIGITGQDGSYLAELLLSEGYIVHGMIRRSSSFNTSRIEHLYQDRHTDNPSLFLHYGDLCDGSSLTRLIRTIHPQEIYNLGAQSHVQVSFELPEYTSNVDGLGTLRVLEAIREVDPTIRFYQASTSELYGKVASIPQNEKTPFHPRSPYAIAKLYSYWITKNYREAYGIFACNGILFNHTSPRRGNTFIVKKIVDGLVSIKNGTQDVLFLGNLDAKRDIGHAKDYVRAMYLMMKASKPNDYVCATGKCYTIRQIVEKVASMVGIDLVWEGNIGMWNNKAIIKTDKAYFRPTEVDLLVGDSTKLRITLGWKPEYEFDDILCEMINHL